VNCPVCGHENQVGAKFCANCGTSLEIVCPVCSAVSPLDANFCSNCGNAFDSTASTTAQPDLAQFVPEELKHKIEAARAGQAMRGERRTVTMLFADIEGSTQAAESLDPEDWAEIMNGAFEHLIAPVYRYEGTLAQLQGDAILAFFGAPIAHEDDAVRAVRAGLDITVAFAPYKAEVLESWDVHIDIRVGINTGLVVVGEMGSDLRVEYTALGDAINTAARMEQTAEAGTVRITSRTASLVSEHFDLEEIGPVEVKGKSEPVLAFRVDKAISSHPEDRPGRRLVGREDELSTLDNLRERLVEGSGWVCMVMGEAGMGKTRLVEEFIHSTTGSVPMSLTREDDGELAVMKAASRSYDSAVPYSTIAQMLLNWWGFDTDAEAHTRLGEIVGELQVDETPDMDLYLAFVAGLTLPESAAVVLDQLEPPALHKRARAAVTGYFEAEFSNRPLMIILEDLHWADSMSLALIDDLMGLADRTATGLVLSMRPYRDEPTWEIREVAQREYHHRYHEILLDQMTTETTTELLDASLGDLQVSDEMRRRILERSDGNPLFIEQIVLALRESEGGEEVGVPTGLEGLLTARLDRLDEQSKLLVQMASVVGSEFDRETLGSLVGDGSDFDARVVDLLRRGILVERPGEGSFAFKHALMQEAAYSTVLLRTRRQLHLRVARHLAQRAPDAVQKIATHYVAADEMELAFPYLVEAGERTARSMALSDAIHFFTTAVENIPPDTDLELVIRAHGGLGLAHSLVPDLTHTAAAYQRLVDYAEEADTPSAKVTALNRLALATATLGGDLPTARNYLEDARGLANEVGDKIGLAEYHMNACFIASIEGDIATAVSHDEETARLGTAEGVDAIRIEGWARLAINATALMDFDRAVPAVDKAMDAAAEAGADHALAIVKGAGLSRLLMREGRPGEALRVLIECEPSLDRFASFYTPMVDMSIGALQYELGEIESGIARMAEARRKAEIQGQGFMIAAASALLARFYAELGIEGSLDELRASALEPLDQPMGDFLSSTVWSGLGYANLARSELDFALEDFQKGLEVSSTSQFWERPGLLVGQALAQAQLDHSSEAQTSIDEADAFVQDKGLVFFEPFVQFGQGMVHVKTGEVGDGLASLGRAADLSAGLGLGPLAVRISTEAAAAAAGAGESEARDRHVQIARARVAGMREEVVDGSLSSAIEAWLEPLDAMLSS
jgi:class 3 adenylate cyclase/tetratricopeptide (TPR) repeat protein